MKIVRITKRFARKVSRDYKSVEFMTELTADVEVETPEQLKEASDSLFRQVVERTVEDMKAFKILFDRYMQGESND